MYHIEFLNSSLKSEPRNLFFWNRKELIIPGDILRVQGNKKDNNKIIKGNR
jgi:hypothetical protein